MKKKILIILIVIISLLFIGIGIFTLLNKKSGFNLVYGKKFDNSSYDVYEDNNSINDYIYDVSPKNGKSFISFSYPKKLIVSSVDSTSIFYESFDLNLYIYESGAYSIDNYIKEIYDKNKKNDINISRMTYDFQKELYLIRLKANDKYIEELLIFYGSDNDYVLFRYVLKGKKFDSKMIDEFTSSIKPTKKMELKDLCDNNCKFDITRFPLYQRELRFKLSDNYKLSSKSTKYHYIIDASDNKISDMSISLLFNNSFIINSDYISQYELYGGNYENVVINGKNLIKAATDNDGLKSVNYYLNLNEHLVIVYKLNTFTDNPDEIIKDFLDIIYE